MKHELFSKRKNGLHFNGSLFFTLQFAKKVFDFMALALKDKNAIRFVRFFTFNGVTCADIQP